MSVTLGWNQGVSKATLPLEDLGENLCPHLFQLCSGNHVPWLAASSEPAALLLTFLNTATWQKCDWGVCFLVTLFLCGDLKNRKSMFLLLLLPSQNSQIPFKTGSFTMALHLCSRSQYTERKSELNQYTLHVFVSVCMRVWACGFIWGSEM